MAVVTAEMIFGGKLVEESAGPFGEAGFFNYTVPTRVITATNATVPAAHQVWSGVLALAAGTLALDLTTSLVRTDRTVLNLTGLRVLGYRIENLGAASLTFLAPVGNPYPMVPATPGLVVGVGAVVQYWRPQGFGTVGASALAITVNGTGTDTFRLGLIAGNP